MKKLLIVSALLLFAGIVSGQTLHKGNIIGMHIIELNLDPDVTYNQYITELNKSVSAFNEVFQGDAEMHLMKVDRGDDENGLCFIFFFKSAEVRAKYFTEDGTATELYTSNNEKVSQILADDSIDLGTSQSTQLNYNDWIIF